MSTSRFRYTVPLAVVLAIATPFALTGCFGNQVESIIEGATGGNVDLGGTSLPDGFPSDEVPLYSGKVVFGASFGKGADQVFNVTVAVPDVGALDDIKGQLEGAGFTASGALGGTTDGGGTLVYTSDKWGVLVVVSKDADKGFTANYTVTTASSN